MSTAADWIRVTRDKPCPICGHKRYCSVAQDGPVQLVCCMWTEDAPSGWWKMKPARTPDGLEKGGVYRQGEKPKPPGPDWAEISRQHRRALTQQRLDQLAHMLGLPAEILKELELGWATDQNAWSTPERRANGDIVGLKMRGQVGDAKWYYDVGGKPHAGLVIPPGLFKLPDPVLIVEGWSDVAACHAVEVTAVGRPSDRGGIVELVKLLSGRRVIVVGEFDAKQSGDWPGRDAAIAVADKLALSWNEPVRWALPPEKAKDCRVWVSRKLQTEPPADIGAELVQHLEETAREVKGTGTAHAESRDLISNVVDLVEKGKARALHVPLPHIVQNLMRITKGWPARVAGVPFVADVKAPRDGQLPTPDAWRLLPKQEPLFGWLHESMDVRWTRGETLDQFTGEKRTPPTKAEFHASIAATAQPNYVSVEIMPHHPPLADSYYLPAKLPKSDGKALAELAEHLNPETEFDRHLLVAAFLTLGWGGPPGRRPPFVLTSDHGMGSGKSQTCFFLTDIWGGHMTVGEHEDWDRVRTRMLSTEALDYRAVVIDNVRGQLARSGLESQITEPRIDGHKLHVGQFSRPNLLTWFISANTPSLSKDLADRSIVIKIGPPKHDTDYEAWSIEFIQKRRVAVIADAIARLKRGSVCEIAKYDRWGPWIDGVLSTFPNANELLEYIREGRPAVDEDLRTAEDVAQVCRHLCLRASCDPELHPLSIKKGDLADWLKADGVIEHRMSARALTFRLRELRTMEPLRPYFTESSGRGRGRRWLWAGPDSSGQVYDYDMDEHGKPGTPFQQTIASAALPEKTTTHADYVAEPDQYSAGRETPGPELYGEAEEPPI